MRNKTNKCTFIDIGIKNFCYLTVEVNDNVLSLCSFEKLQVNNISEVVSLMDNLVEESEKFYIESQNYKNTKCVRLESAIITYCIVHKLAYTGIKAKKKIKMLNIDTSNYYRRKKGVVSKGEELLKRCTVSEELLTQISELSKKDDFYDCFLMAFTELVRQ